MDYGNAYGEFKLFEIKYGSTAEELSERIGAAILYPGDTNRRIDEGGLENKKGFETLAVKQDQMPEKQDMMLKNEDKMLGKQDQMPEKQDQTIDSINRGFTRMDDNFKHFD